MKIQARRLQRKGERTGVGNAELNSSAEKVGGISDPSELADPPSAEKKLNILTSVLLVVIFP